MRNKLTIIINKSFAKQYEERGLLTTEHTVDDLIANGVILLPCKKGDLLPYDGKDYKIDHWNVLATAFSEDKKLHIFSIEDAEKALKEKENV